MITCTRRLEWDAMHRVPGHEGKCKAFHGHRYVAEITCRAPDDQLDDVGRVVDFGVIKARVGQFIDDRWDHTAILWSEDEDPAVKAIAESNAAHGRPVYWLAKPPTAEYIAEELGRVAGVCLQGTGVEVVSVRVYETPNCRADWQP